MIFDYYLHNDILLLRVEGDLLGLPHEAALVRIARLHLNENVKHCAVDLSDIKHINSRGMSLLIRILNLVDHLHGNMVLINPPAQTKKLLKITKLDLAFVTVDTRSEGVRLLRQQARG
ncbi:STAS domain-containing protein [Sediminitomix flava]|uniref:Anti-sigma B factor antagonist n=1 Tax=Sediminitomix flava TaxID=379075 RepID=A0A315Z668_SEDFL|nr:STAS domain-containing protein [Sediminitomix flava]PWJ39212.1 anti-sigma B factor antagonist [Sediminitomix flava]